MNSEEETMNFDIEEDDEAFVNLIDHLDDSYRSLCDEVVEMCKKKSFKYLKWDLFEERLDKLRRLRALEMKYFDEHIEGTATEQNLEDVRQYLLESYAKLFIARKKRSGKVVEADAFDRLLADLSKRAGG